MKYDGFETPLTVKRLVGNEERWTAVHGKMLQMFSESSGHATVYATLYLSKAGCRILWKADTVDVSGRLRKTQPGGKRVN